jgi:hypothetical protein
MTGSTPEDMFPTAVMVPELLVIPLTKKRAKLLGLSTVTATWNHDPVVNTAED